MNAARSPSRQAFGRQSGPPITFGQVAAHASTFSQSSALPASFGNYDSFYLTLRGSGNDTRQRQQKQWLRRHQYRGDEKIRHGIARRRTRTEKERSKYPASPFSSPEKLDDVYEDDDIEAERFSGGANTMTMLEGNEPMNHNQQSCQPTQVSPATSPYETCINLQPKISCDLDKEQHMHPIPKKRDLAPMDLDEAFMELTLNMNPSLVTPDATSIGDHLKALAQADDEVTELSTSVEPVAASRSSSLCSNLNAQLEAVDLSQNQSAPESETTFDASYSSPAKRTCQKTTADWTPCSKSPQTNSSASTPLFDMTPLSKAICRESKVRSSTLCLSPPTATPKRKPRGSVSSSSKRRKRNPSTITASSPVPRQLYNGRAIERIQDMRKCTDINCRWNPSLHKLKAACERCWTLASESERIFFVKNGGRHLRINLVKGGCPSSCKLFAHRVKVPIDGNDDEDVRLCRKCFDDMHHVGIRNTDY